MAATLPLFYPELASLRKDLRLTGADTTGNDFENILETSLLQVRVGFNTRLGPTRVAELVAITYSPNPTTENEILRAIARVCEARWVRLVLMDLLPTLFMDASGSAQQDYNEQAAFRSTDTDQRAEERGRLQVQIDEWLAILAGEVQLGDTDVEARIFVTERPDPLPRPNDSPWLQNPPGPEVVNPGSFDGNFVVP